MPVAADIAVVVPPTVEVGDLWAFYTISSMLGSSLLDGSGGFLSDRGILTPAQIIASLPGSLPPAIVLSTTRLRDASGIETDPNGHVSDGSVVFRTFNLGGTDQDILVVWDVLGQAVHTRQILRAPSIPHIQRASEVAYDVGTGEIFWIEGNEPAGGTFIYDFYKAETDFSNTTLIASLDMSSVLPGSPASVGISTLLIGVSEANIIGASRVVSTPLAFGDIFGSITRAGATNLTSAHSFTSTDFLRPPVTLPSTDAAVPAGHAVGPKSSGITGCKAYDDLVGAVPGGFVNLWPTTGFFDIVFDSFSINQTKDRFAGMRYVGPAGRLYSDTLAGPFGTAPAYNGVAMFNHPAFSSQPPDLVIAKEPLF